MLKSITFGAVIEEGHTFELDVTRLRQMLPSQTDLDRVIVEKFALKEYSSSSPTCLALTVDPPLGEWVHGVHALGVGPCLAILMPFCNGGPVSGTTMLEVPSEVVATNVAQKYRNFVQRLPSGQYSIDKTAPFAHRLEPLHYIGDDTSLQASEQDMTEAMVKHEKYDRFFNLSDGLTFTIHPLEKGDIGPIRMVFNMILTLTPKPIGIFAKPVDETNTVVVESEGVV